MLNWATNALRGETSVAVFRRGMIIALISFLTLIDLFGSQALLPQLVEAYDADPTAMGFAVNASTIGMAISGLVVAYFSHRINRKRGIWISLVLLSIPTAGLAIAPDVETFMVLRILQGMCMSAAFTLTLTFLSERCSITAASGAMAAYITGNVASNLFGRLIAVGFADGVGLAESFLAFAALNLLGAFLAGLFIGWSSPVEPALGGERPKPLRAMMEHARHGGLRHAFMIGFLLLFIFVGGFTYVNFELVSPRLGLPAAYLGLVYFIFLPSIFTTPVAGKVAGRFGARNTFWAAGFVTLIGIGMTLTNELVVVLVGLSLLGAGTFFAQAAATGYVGRTAKHNHAAANGLYLTSYYVGGLVGAIVLGFVYQAQGWIGLAMALGVALIIAMLLALRLKETPPPMLNVEPAE